MAEMHANTAIAPVALLIVVLIDQAFKSIVQTCLPKRRVSCAPWLEIRRVLHRKQIYGSSSGRALLVALWLAGLLYAFFLLPRTGWLRGDYSMLGIAIALGGAAGNLADILRLGSVVDFIDLGWWPVFNVADAAIVSGLLLAFWS